jgi:phytoene dehydrogenase-like protein
MTAHVVGAGLAGLGAATALAARGVAVELSEAAAQAGGRCRSYFDPQIGLTIDNGNHLVLSGNKAVHEYLARIGASDPLRPASRSSTWRPGAPGPSGPTPERCPGGS